MRTHFEEAEGFRVHKLDFRRLTGVQQRGRFNKSRSVDLDLQEILS